MIKNSFLMAAGLSMLLIACQQDDAPTPKPQPDKLHRLTSITYKKAGIKMELSYNADSTLKNMSASAGIPENVTYYNYANGKLSETGYTNSMYKHVYYYNIPGGDKVMKVVTENLGIPGNNYHMEYTYNAKGQVVTQKYFHTNEAGTQLKSNSDYQYNAAGLLTLITTDAGTIKYRFKIDSYSDEYAVTPMVFIPHSLTEFYPLYNYPVITSMKRLPAKITKTHQLPGGAEETVRIDEQTFSISNKRINQIIQVVDIPGHPELHARDTAVFAY